MPDRVGRYELIEKLARGGMGDVWLARDPELGREVAIKTIRREVEGTDANERFLREARAAAQCQHPGIVTIHDFGVHEGSPFLVMERVHGRTLRQHLDADGVFEVAEAMRIGAEVADALTHSHELGVLHRDITPSNIVTDSNGAARLLDFGLVRDLGSPTSELSTHAMLGTPSFLAPEQAFGAPEEVDARADVYGLGATLFATITGDAPFVSPTLLGLLRRIEEDDVPASGHGPQVDAILRRALAKDPEHRFQTAREFGDALRAWRPNARPRRTARPVRVTTSASPASRTRNWSIAILALISVVVVAGIVDWSGTSEPTALTVAHAFGIPAIQLRDETFASMLSEGRFGEAASVRPIASIEGWIALALCSPPGLRRSLHGDAFRVALEAPVPVREDTPAAAGLQLLEGDVHDALGTIADLREDEDGAPVLDVFEVHGLLALPEDDFDRERADEILERLLAAPNATHPLFESGLVDLLRQRMGYDEPLFFDVERRSEVVEREIVASLLLAGLGRHAAATEVAVHALELDLEDPWSAAHVGWLQMTGGIVERERFTLPSQLASRLREVAALEHAEVAYPAAIVLGVHSVLEGDGGDAITAVRRLEELIEDHDFDPDRLHFPLGALLVDPDGPESLIAESHRELLDAFGQIDRAARIAQRVADSGARDIEDHDDRRELLAENALARARYAEDEANAVSLVLRAIELGVDIERIEEEDELERLLDSPEVAERLRR